MPLCMVDKTKTTGRAMKQLDVSDCDLDDSDVHEVLELVQSCPCLEVLDLRCGN